MLEWITFKIIIIRLGIITYYSILKQIVTFFCFYIKRDKICCTTIFDFFSLVYWVSRLKIVKINIIIKLDLTFQTISK